MQAWIVKYIWMLIMVNSVLLRAFIAFKLNPTPDNISFRINPPYWLRILRTVQLQVKILRKVN